MGHKQWQWSNHKMVYSSCGVSAIFRWLFLFRPCLHNCSGYLSDFINCWIFLFSYVLLLGLLLYFKGMHSRRVVLTVFSEQYAHRWLFVAFAVFCCYCFSSISPMLAGFLLTLWKTYAYSLISIQYNTSFWSGLSNLYQYSITLLRQKSPVIINTTQSRY